MNNYIRLTVLTFCAHVKFIGRLLSSGLKLMTIDMKRFLLHHQKRIASHVCIEKNGSVTCYIYMIVQVRKETLMQK